MRNKIGTLCHNCGQVTYQLAGSLEEYGGCRVCRGFTKSKGEMILFSILKASKINFTYQFPIKPKNYKNKLYADFFIPDKKIIIEFDGIQHSEPNNIPYWWDVGNIKYRDEVKDEWANSNGIKMVRLNRLNLKYIIKSLKTCLDEKITVPDKIQEGNWYLPIKEINSYVSSHTYKETEKEFGIGESMIKKIINLYK